MSIIIPTPSMNEWGFGSVSHRVAGRVWNSLFDQRWVIVLVWSGGLKETQVASALPTTYLQKKGFNQALHVQSSARGYSREPGNVEVAKIRSIFANFSNHSFFVFNLRFSEPSQSFFFF